MACLEKFSLDVFWKHVPDQVDTLYQDSCPFPTGYESGRKFGLLYVDFSMAQMMCGNALTIVPS
jgi:hypothetical protein